ncbi:hypothetical protein HYR99_32360 [Candidatus Poribacteria bacterium]|nr:hypothetical protein [Candidatus Poribacteria bacterium]
MSQLFAQDLVKELRIKLQTDGLKGMELSELLVLISDQSSKEIQASIQLSQEIRAEIHALTDQLSKQTDQVSKQLDQVSTQIAQVGAQIDRFEQRFDRFEQRFKKIGILIAAGAWAIAASLIANLIFKVLGF